MLGLSKSSPRESLRSFIFAATQILVKVLLFHYNQDGYFPELVEISFSRGLFHESQHIVTLHKSPVFFVVVVVVVLSLEY